MLTIHYLHFFVDILKIHTYTFLFPFLCYHSTFSNKSHIEGINQANAAHLQQQHQHHDFTLFIMRRVHHISIASQQHLNTVCPTPPRPPSPLQIGVYLFSYLLLHFTTLLLCPLWSSICTVIVSKRLSERLWFIERVVQTNKQHVFHCSRWCQKHEKMRKRWRRWEKSSARKHITWLQIRGQKARANYIKWRQPWFSTKGKTSIGAYITHAVPDGSILESL